MEISVNNISDDLVPVSVSQLGTVVYDNVVFPGAIWFDNDGNSQTFEEVKLDAVAIRVNRQKEIVKSRVAGKKGTIKEYTSTGDFTISITAIIAPDTFTSTDIAGLVASRIPGASEVGGLTGAQLVKEPTVLLKRIAAIERVEDRLAVECKFLNNIHEVNYVVIEDYSLNKITADSYSLELTLISDFEIDLTDAG